MSYVTFSMDVFLNFVYSFLKRFEMAVFLRQDVFLKGILFVHLLNVFCYKLILCNVSKIFPRL